MDSSVHVSLETEQADKDEDGRCRSNGRLTFRWFLLIGKQCLRWVCCGEMFDKLQSMSLEQRIDRIYLSKATDVRTSIGSLNSSFS